MPDRSKRRVALAALAILGCASAGSAQTYESVGTRARGMGGAFVAVADDATATWWNPAGLAGGAYFSSVVEFGSAQDPATDVAGQPASRTDTRSLAVAYPALGVSYYRLGISEVLPTSPTASVGADRQDLRPTAVGVRSIVLQQFGVTVGQSLGSHFVLASTAKLLRGSAGFGAVPAAQATLDTASNFEGSGSFSADLDIGVMATYRGLRGGLSLRNVTEPSFGDGSAEVTLGRQARAGASYTTIEGSRGNGVTFAVDADLTETPTALGQSRRVAGGIEAWLLGHRFALRGGVNRNTVGDRSTVGSAGVSVAVKSAVYLEAAALAGSDARRRGWTVDVRVGL